METNKNGMREVSSAPNTWFKDGKLLWPPKGASTKRKNRCMPEDNWEACDYKILKESIGRSILSIISLVNSYNYFKKLNIVQDHFARLY